MSEAHKYKTTEHHFIDWESDVFGHGYGSGEQYTLKALKDFLNLCPVYEDFGTNYHYKALEKELTPVVAWLMLNILLKTDILEYGTSPRHGWLTGEGVSLKRFIENKNYLPTVELAIEWVDKQIMKKEENKL